MGHPYRLLLISFRPTRTWHRMWLRPSAHRHGKKLHWLPFRLGVAVVKVMGLKPLLDTPLKGPYARHDISRMAKVLGVPLTDDFSMFDPVPAQQLMYTQPREQRPALAKALFECTLGWKGGAWVTWISCLMLLRKRWV